VKSERDEYTTEEETVSVTISDNLTEIDNNIIFTFVERVKDAPSNGGACVM
jgi:hypothetical protein